MKTSARRPPSPTRGGSLSVDDLLERYPEQVRETAAATRALLKDKLPGVAESADGAAKLLAFSYGPGYKGAVCTLILSQTGVKLGIVRGAELPDPKRLMAGEGKVHRYVQLRSPADLDRPGLAALLAAARKACQARLSKAAQDD